MFVCSQTVESVTLKVFGLLGYEIVILYSRRIWQFGGLPHDRQIKIRKISYLHYYTYSDPVPNHQI